MKRIVGLFGGIVLLAGASGCGRERSEETVQVEVAQGGTSGGQAPQQVYAVGQAAPGGPAAPDYVAQHMAIRYQQYAPDMVADTPLYHGYLQQGQEERFETVLQAGFCYRVVGVGGPSMNDLDLFIVDENGNAIAHDTEIDNFPVLGLGESPICPRWTGPFYLRALAYSGYGEYGLQLFRSP